MSTYLARIKDYHGDDWIEIEADYIQGAAANLSQKVWSSDPCDPSSVEDIVEVMDGDKIRKFIVYAEASVHFTAREIK